MDYTVYEGTQAVGQLTIQPDGLYYVIECKLNEGEPLRRLYGIHGLQSIYLGIPNYNGELHCRISKKRLPIPQRVIASVAAPGQWLPWSGDSFGVFLYDAFMKHEGDSVYLAVNETESEQLPQWRNLGQRETVVGSPMVCIPMDPNGQPPQIETENGGERNEEREVTEQTQRIDHSEIHTTKSGIAIDPLLLADLPADYDYGSAESEEADRDHL